jgi:sulfite exporter TauE/SafE
MIALAAAVFLASLLGSTHCAGMCGAFLAFAVAGDDRPSQPRARLHAAYNGGRLFTYMTLGAAAGALGSAVDLGGSAVGIQRAAASLAGAIMLGFGLVAVLRLTGVRIPRAPLPRFLRDTAAAGHRAVLDWSPLARAGAIGLLTTLLPCGWLYAFVITAAGTADPLTGAATMAVFWAGTLPVMVGLGVGVQALAGPLRARLPMLTSLLLVGVGAAMLLGRLHAPAMAAAPRGPVGTEHLIEHVETLNSSEMPCCK